MELHKNILVFPAGTEIAFEIANALKYSKFVTLYGGTSVQDHSEFVFEHLITNFPYVHEDGFIDYLNRVIEENDIDCIYPAHDSVCVILSKYASKINAQVIVTEYETTRICRSKLDTYKYLEEENFIPGTYADITCIEKYPVFVKPAVGQGSNGAIKIDSEDQLRNALAADSSLIICEYLPGMEYTVDCFTNRKGELLTAKLRDRQRIRAGISVRSRNLAMNPEVERIANTLNKKFHFQGAWFFQLKKNMNGQYRLLEVSPRIPGTMGLSRNLGINFPMLTLFDFWGYDVSILDNQYDILLDRAFYSAYRIDYEYDHVYVDFDDTLIIDGKVNSSMMRLLYQFSNQNKKIHLLSKHSTDILEDLKKYRISSELFDEIKVIDANDEKSEYIKESSSVFIDDSFAERKKVSQKIHIPVFDLDMVESLIDWRLK